MVNYLFAQKIQEPHFHDALPRLTVRKYVPWHPPPLGHDHDQNNYPGWILQLRCGTCCPQLACLKTRHSSCNTLAAELAAWSKQVQQRFIIFFARLDCGFSAYYKILKNTRNNYLLAKWLRIELFGIGQQLKHHHWSQYCQFSGEPKNMVKVEHLMIVRARVCHPM